MHHPTDPATTLDRWYMSLLACTAADLARTGGEPLVIPSEARLQSVGARVRPLIGICRAGGGTVLSVHPEHAKDVRLALRANTPPATADQVAAAAKGALAATWPTAWIAVHRVLTTATPVQPPEGIAVAVDGQAHRQTFRALSREGEPAAVATAAWEDGAVADIGVTTRPTFRRQGYGKAAVAAAIRSVVERGGTPMYAHRTDNVASQALADALGLHVYGYFLDVSILDLTGEVLAQLSPGARGALVTHGAFHLPDQSWQSRSVHDADTLFGAASAAHRLCSLLAAPGRLDVACGLLRLGPADLPEIAAACGLPAPEVVGHLAALREEGLARLSTDAGFPAFSVPPGRRSVILALLTAAAEMG